MYIKNSKIIYFNKIKNLNFIKINIFWILICNIKFLSYMKFQKMKIELYIYENSFYLFSINWSSFTVIFSPSFTSLSLLRVESRIRLIDVTVCVYIKHHVCRWNFFTYVVLMFIQIFSFFIQVFVIVLLYTINVKRK